VYLPQEVQERYKQLYAKDIKINGETMSDAIYNNVTQMIDDGNLTGIVPKLGDLQAEIDSTVNAYKAAARERMFGKTKNYGKELVYTMQGVGVNYGLTSDKVEYPDLALEIQKAHRDARLVGR
jgi:proteasome assembly chaperone (PAC2) family protein